MQKWFICVLKDDISCVWGYGATRQEARKDAGKWIKEYYGDGDYDDDQRPNLNTDLVVYEASDELHSYILNYCFDNSGVPLEIVKGKAVLTTEARLDRIKAEVYKIMNKAEEDVLKVFRNNI